ncbi:hypothetical protein S7335_11 [Synechococcus sp. PCC 7335]|uniref:ferritin-like domain-containing protein n=1 Tax=Synechococcus sp. (strain ATCC 29403 / PCC 7335) TaxID=91464 RepID=UPI00017EB8FC|nr:DUF2202 domain-containing protein [Synechococcus sp. PCC 7335]EDX82833.1 hypothetical protein S7335_11 [Synechococcus sp. PCC 7335]
MPTSANETPNERTQQAMTEAINDEYRARAFYQAVIEKFGAVRPFSNIVQAEDRHVQRWQSLFNQYGLPIPEDTFAGNVEAPETLAAACEMGIEAEIADAQMYERFLTFVEEPDLRATFTQLQQVSQNNHKVAFERCARRLSSGRQQGQHHGQHHGHGQGSQGNRRNRRHQLL